MPFDPHVRELPGLADLIERWGPDPFLQHDVAPELVDRVLLRGRAAAFRRMPHSRAFVSLCLIGPAADVDALLAYAAREGLLDEVGAVSVERPLLPLLESRVKVTTGGDWDWMWTATDPPPVAEESLVETLDDALDARALLALNEIGNPTSESEPGTGRTEHWVGVRDGDQVVAAAALHRTSRGAPHLAGITVAPEHRGRRLGLAVTASLTRTALQWDGISTLGMYAGNDVARRVYQGLGYTVARQWSSRRLADTTSPTGEARSVDQETGEASCVSAAAESTG